jgi:hypothetical protein
MQMEPDASDIDEPAWRMQSRASHSSKILIGSLDVTVPRTTAANSGTQPGRFYLPKNVFARRNSGRSVSASFATSRSFV